MFNAFILLVGWLVCWFIGSLVRWLVGWLNGCVPMFLNPYLPQSLCSPIRMFPHPDVPRPYIPQSLPPPRCTPYVSHYLCSPVPLLPGRYVLPFFYSLVSIYPRNGSPSLCSSKIFLSPIATQNRCYPAPMLPRAVSSPCVPQRCSQSLCCLDPLFPSPDVPQNWKTLLGNIGTGWTKLWGNKRTGEHLWGTHVPENISCEFRLWA